MKEKTVYIESLGCNKNTVDSEILLSILKKKGYSRTGDPDKAVFVIVNTCAFIDAAKQETIDTVFELAGKKSPEAKLIVAGCFSQLYHREIVKEMPEVDAVIGTGNLEAIINAVEGGITGKYFPESMVLPKRFNEYGGRTELLTPAGYAYIKISEGCSRNCSFCLIPRIKGRLRSRNTADIVEEATQLEKMGVKELIITSQDTLRFGSDRSEKESLSSLIQSLLSETGIPFFRLLYLRPGRELIRNLDIFSNNRVVPYLDIPLQHVSKKILQLMHRDGDYYSYREIIAEIRKKIPHAVLRSTFIVGFPGETEEDFTMLLDFMQEIRFNHLGVFVFSPQEHTDAAVLPMMVDEKTAEKRREAVFALQKNISKEMLSEERGKTFPVLIEENIEEEHISLGRSYHFAPEVDGLFVVHSNTWIEPGSLIRALVTHTGDYDLFGMAV